MSYRKLYQNCCGYFCDRGSCPQDWKIDFSLTDFGPGYEPLSTKWKFEFDDGPNPAVNCRCRWRGYIGAEIGFVLERRFQDSAQLLVVMVVEMLWPAKGGRIVWDIGTAGFAYTHCGGEFILDHLAFLASMDGLLNAPAEARIGPWLTSD